LRDIAKKSLSKSCSSSSLARRLRHGTENGKTRKGREQGAKARDVRACVLAVRRCRLRHSRLATRKSPHFATARLRRKHKKERCKVLVPCRCENEEKRRLVSPTRTRHVMDCVYGNVGEEGQWRVAAPMLSGKCCRRSRPALEFIMITGSPSDTRRECSRRPPAGMPSQGAS